MLDAWCNDPEYNCRTLCVLQVLVSVGDPVWHAMYLLHTAAYTASVLIDMGVWRICSSSVHADTV